MILYFTGTGNSKFAANCIAEWADDTAFSMNDVMKREERLQAESEKPFVIVAPIYAWRYPLPVERILRDADLSGSREIYFVATCESQTGKAERYLRRIAEEKHMNCKGFTAIPMPNNYILADVTTDEEAERQLNAAYRLLCLAAERIRQGKSLVWEDHTILAGLMSGPVNLITNRFVVSSRDFFVADACIACGLCDKLCPMNNIDIINDRPVFGKKCIWCFNCIQHCPKSAIEIRGRTEGKPRRVCPEYATWRMNKSQ